MPKQNTVAPTTEKQYANANLNFFTNDKGIEYARLSILFEDWQEILDNAFEINVLEDGRKFINLTLFKVKNTKNNFYSRGVEKTM